MLEKLPEILLVMSVDFTILIGVVLSLFLFRQYKNPSLVFDRFVTGLLFGLVGILYMNFSTVVTPGVILDLRLLPILLAGYLYGPVSALVTGLLIAGFRSQLQGIGLVSALAATLTATIYSMVVGWRWRSVESLRGIALISVGLTLVTLPLGIFLIPERGPQLVAQVAPYFFIFHTGGAIIVMHISLVFSHWRRTELAHQRLLEQIHMSDKMSALGQLTSGITHDINNDLTVISGYAQLICQNIEAHKAPRFAESILQACERSSQLIQNLLIFAKKARTNPQVLDLCVVVENLLPTLRSTLGKHIEIRFERQTEQAIIRADSSMLESALLNLCINARDAMENGGVLIIAVAEGQDPGYSEQPVVKLSVSDTGTGMSEEVRQHLFEPFFTTKRKGYGTGLGLSMVFGFVQQAGASIEVVSSPGQGASFELIFPRQSALALNKD